MLDRLFAAWNLENKLVVSTGLVAVTALLISGETAGVPNIFLRDNVGIDEVGVPKMLPSDGLDPCGVADGEDPDVSPKMLPRDGSICLKWGIST